MPVVFSSEPDRLVGFEREARVVASLSHTNIAGIHDVGEQGGHHLLVMDLALFPTLTFQATMTGAILGTAAYMSPEQAKGRRGASNLLSDLSIRHLSTKYSLFG